MSVNEYMTVIVDGASETQDKNFGDNLFAARQRADALAEQGKTAFVVHCTDPAIYRKGGETSVVVDGKSFVVIHSLGDGFSIRTTADGDDHAIFVVAADQPVFIGFHTRSTTPHEDTLRRIAREFVRARA